MIHDVIDIFSPEKNTMEYKQVGADFTNCFRYETTSNLFLSLTDEEA